MAENYGKRQQKVAAEPVMLALLANGLGGGAKTVDFSVSIPDSRLRTKIAVVFLPIQETGAFNTGGNILLDAAQSLWLASREKDLSGRRGCMMTVNNIVGTASAPVSIRGDANVCGFSGEWVTAADEIFGRITVNGNTYGGRWMLQASWQPDGLYLPCDEWEWIASQCTTRAETAYVNEPGTFS